MDPGVRMLLQQTPDRVGSFEGTEWPLPVLWAFHAGPPRLPDLRAALLERADQDVKKSIAPALCLAELIEAVRPDRLASFIDDNRARAYAFRGAKWRAGWACLVGRDDRDRLAKLFHDERFMVFAPEPGENVDVALSPRPTALIYFLQMMVRYGFIYGLIKPGDDHELAHFLERDMPGVVVAMGDLTHLENLMVLGLMYLGAPAVVGPGFPYDYGRRAVAETPEAALAEAMHFPNLRVRKTVAGQVALPDFCDPAHRRETFTAASAWGGSAASWFCVRPGQVTDGVAVEGTPGEHLGLLVEIGDPACRDVVTDWLEEVAGTAPAMIQGVRADLKSAPRIELAANADVTPEQVAEAIRGVLRHQYPRLQHIRVALTFGCAPVDRLREEVDAFKARRQAAINRLSDATVDEVYACIDCQTFSHGHVCFLTPGRPSMCSTRPFLSAMAAAYFGDILQPWRRRSLGDRAHQTIVKLGRCLDPNRGEYEGINQAAQDLSGGAVRRVFLHDLRDFPHTSCGCFWAIAFYIPEVDGVGIMTRDFKGTAPDGSTWMTLANRAGGKQAPGMAGIGREYLASPDFLRGHGGSASVVWASATAAEGLREVGPDLHFAVGEEVATIGQLRGFLTR